MIAFKEVTYLKNLQAETQVQAWPASDLHNSVPNKSLNGVNRHIYLTNAGLLIWNPEKQVGITWDDLFAFVETVAPELLGVKEEKKTPAIQPAKT